MSHRPAQARRASSAPRPDLRRHVSDKQPPRVVVEVDGHAEKPRQERAERDQWHQPARILDQKRRRQVRIASPNPAASFVRHKLAVDIVEPEFPVLAFDPGAYAPERLQGLQQPDIFAAVAVDDRQRVCGHRGVNGNTLFVSRGTGAQKDQRSQQGGERFVRRGG